MTRPAFGPLHLVASGGGPVVVLVHGVVGSHLIWDPLVPYLEPHYTVARVDLAGYGSSPAPAAACTPGRHAEEIRSTLIQAELLPPYVVVGLSMGCAVALTYAARWPDEIRDLVGIALPYFDNEEDARRWLSRDPWTHLTLRFPRLARVALPALWWALRSSRLTRLHRGIYSSAMADDALRVNYSAFRSSMLNCMLHYPFGASLAATGARRRLFVHGSEDRWAAVDVVRRALAPFPATRFSVIADAPHNIVVTEPAQTAEVLLDYLAPVTSGPP